MNIKLCHFIEAIWGIEETSTMQAIRRAWPESLVLEVTIHNPRFDNGFGQLEEVEYECRGCARDKGE